MTKHRPDESDSTVSLSRRRFLQTAAAAAAGSLAFPYLSLGDYRSEQLLTHSLGRTGFGATTFGLGGQASLQWTPPDIDPERIILKALDRGVNYFDTSNVYGHSQLVYGRAFRRLHLVPGLPGYDEKRRRSIYVATKTMRRSAKGMAPQGEGSTDGPPGSTALDDVRRSLSQLFGDGRGSYPEGAYLDCVQIHMCWSPKVVDAIYYGLENPDPRDERIGALAGLLDLRDGTNYTGLNPKEERLIRHIGLTGHSNSPVLMECLQRDDRGIFDTLLVAINPNDRRRLTHQFNVVPVAQANRVGVIGMKVFADGAMYGKPADWTYDYHDVVQTIGSPRLPSRALIQYTLSTPGVDTCIIGIGHIDNDPRHCQLERNLRDAQMTAPLDEKERRRIEQLTAAVAGDGTNWFQLPNWTLGAPRNIRFKQRREAGLRKVRLAWDTAIALDEPLVRYEIMRDYRRVATVPHHPQVSLRKPFVYEETLADRDAHVYVLTTVDAAGRTASSQEFLVPAIG